MHDDYKLNQWWLRTMMKTVMIVGEGLCLGTQQITQKERGNQWNI